MSLSHLFGPRWSGTAPVWNQAAWLAAAFSLLSIWTIGLRLSFGPAAIGQDEGLFMAVADQWLHGARLYRDYWDNKPPGIFAIYAAINLLLGPTDTAVHAAATATVLLSSIAAGLAAWILSGRRLAALLAAFTLPAYTLDLGGIGAQPELFMMLPQTVALCLLARLLRARQGARVAAITGLLFGVLEGALFETKFPAAVDGLGLYAVTVACLAWAGLPRRSRPSAWRAPLGFTLATAVGAAIVPLIVYLGFTASGGWGDLVFSNFISPRLYITTPFGLDNPLRALTLLASRMSYFVLPLAVIAAYGLRLLLGFLRHGSGGRHVDPAWALPACWIVTAVIGAAASGYYRYYYFMALTPPVVILASICLADWVMSHGTWSRPRLDASATAILIGAMALSFYPLQLHYRKLGTDQLNSDYPVEQALVGIIKALEPAEGGTLFAGDLTPALYPLTATKPVTRYPQAIAHIFDIPERFGVDPLGELDTIFAQRPAVVVGSRHAFGADAKYGLVLRRYLAAYQPVALPSWLAEKVVVYQRPDLPTTR